jgi:D-amino-acid dehydrogenase
MVRPASPFWIRPQLNLSMVGWLFRFWRSSSQKHFRVAAKALVELNAPVLELLDHYRASGVAFESHSRGLLFPALSVEAAHRDATLYEELRLAGYSGRFCVLRSDAVHELEPRLADTVTAALYSLDERHVEPASLTKGLVNYLALQGVEVIERCPVEGLSRSGGRWRLQTPAREIAADAVVLAAGVWTGALLRSVGYPLTILSGKGYSITFQTDETLLTRPAYLSEAKVGVTPFAKATRIAGTFELTGIDPALRARRLNALRRAATTYIRDWPPSTTNDVEWAGLRPVVGDGLPVIGPVPDRKGLYVATGHGMVGVTMSGPTGKALAETIVERRVPERLIPFGLERFH